MTKKKTKREDLVYYKKFNFNMGNFVYVQKFFGESHNNFLFELW